MFPPPEYNAQSVHHLPIQKLVDANHQAFEKPLCGGIPLIEILPRMHHTPAFPAPASFPEADECVFHLRVLPVMLYHASAHFARGKRKKLARRHIRAELGLAVGDEADVLGDAQPLFVYHLQRAAEQLDNAANHGLRAQRRNHGRNIQVEDNRAVDQAALGGDRRTGHHADNCALLDPPKSAKRQISVTRTFSRPTTFFFQKSSFVLDKLKLA